MMETIKQGSMYYYGVNNDIIEIKKIQSEKVTYIQNKQEYTASLDVVRSNIGVAGNRIVFNTMGRINKLNEKINQSKNRDNKLYLEYKDLIQLVVNIIYGKRYKYEIKEDIPTIIHIDSGVEFEFDPLNVFSHAAREILPWFNVHDFLYHFSEDEKEVVLKIYDKSNDLQNLIIRAESKSICLLRGVVEANTLYLQRERYESELLGNIAKNIYKNKKLEEKKDYILVILDKYNEEVIEFNPLKNSSQAIDVVLTEISKVFDYNIEKKGMDYTMSVLTFDANIVLEERGKDLKKLICLVYESLLGN